MSPHYNDQDRAERAISGPRPSSLLINKHSNVIQKPSLQHGKLPVIIYVRSPQIIHTQPSEFMALVQNLTGFMHQNDDAVPKDFDVNKSSSFQNSNLNKNIVIVSDNRHEIKESSWDVADEKYDENGDVREASSPVLPTTRSRSRTLLEDFPLYTPNYSADQVLKFSDMVFQSPNMRNISIPSPSFKEVMKDLPQY
ncbi:VQ domain-containing protein [Heracleum sosnowskyi]|uniref:VQ domain-containing protein n=1 Tax=Heracleum sosnowskyi TaxID=360622 RepID=A0AAD8I8V2_9APIA|nr:VQ domain-containing protein [Heracleum sosnowskyi]